MTFYKRELGRLAAWPRTGSIYMPLRAIPTKPLKSVLSCGNDPSLGAASADAAAPAGAARKISRSILYVRWRRNFFRIDCVNFLGSQVFTVEVADTLDWKFLTLEFSGNPLKAIS